MLVGLDERDNYPSVEALYAANGLIDHTDCQYLPTPHTYDRPNNAGGLVLV